jgi:hypothetical protein
MRNFAYPYFSRDIAEFWRRWHISLSSWFKDYVYIPLGGSRVSMPKRIRNVFIIFLVSGFWHGANWTFIVWGGLNALYFLPLMLAGVNRKYIDIVANDRFLPSLKEFFQIIGTFFITLIAWVFFRAQNLNQALQYVYNMLIGLYKWLIYIFHNLGTANLKFDSFSHLLLAIFPIPISYLKTLLISLYFILLLIIVEWLQLIKQHGLEFTNIKIPRLLRWLIYFTLIILIIWFGGKQQQFIYFQF